MPNLDRGRKDDFASWTGPITIGYLATSASPSTELDQDGVSPAAESADDNDDLTRGPIFGSPPEKLVI